MLLERDENWNINITKVSKFFNKRWSNWRYDNKATISSLETFLKCKVIISATRGRNGSTWLVYELAVLVLNAWSFDAALQLTNYYKEAYLENLKKRKKRFSFQKGPCIYCYSTNGFNKVGVSDGTYGRIKNHKSSVAAFSFNWVIFLSEARDVERALKNRFLFPDDRPANNREHYSASADNLKGFIISYCRLLKYPIKELSELDLKTFQKSL